MALNLKHLTIKARLKSLPKMDMYKNDDTILAGVRHLHNCKPPRCTYFYNLSMTICRTLISFVIMLQVY